MSAGSPAHAGGVDSPQVDGGHSPIGGWFDPASLGAPPGIPPGMPGMPGMPDILAELNTIHAANASCAAYQADVAAKHAASLAQWVQYLWGLTATLQHKVVELEDWKMKTLDDMNKLRFEHKLLRKKVAPGAEEDDAPALPGKAKSLPLLLAEHVDPGSDIVDKKGKKGKAAAGSAGTAIMRPPPGLAGGSTASGDTPQEASFDGLEKSKSVRFAPPVFGESSPAAASSPKAEDSSGDPPIGVLRSLSVLSEISHITDAPDEGLLEGVNVVPGVVDGLEAEVAQWRIGHLSTKLRGCMGRALVSSPFCMWGLQDLRLMVFPDGKEVVKGPRSRRQKELYAKKVSEGPLEGCLKLKVPESPSPHVLKYYMKIGSCRCGPFEHNFSESTVNGCLDFAVDWLQQVDSDHSLTVTVEVLKFGAVADAKASGSD